MKIEVADRGPGIPVEERERIFERFYRARHVRGRPVRGSGIGLSLVKHVAEAHGGGVTVGNSTVGQGSTRSHPDLGCRSSQAAIHGAICTRRRASSPCRRRSACGGGMTFDRKKILIIEDEPDIVRGLRDSLEFEGFEVLSATEGREGVKLAAGPGS